MKSRRRANKNGEMVRAIQWEGAISSERTWGSHIPYEQWGAVWSYLEFPNHLIVWVLMMWLFHVVSPVKMIRKKLVQARKIGSEPTKLSS